MANLTLAIDDDLLQQAREVALRDKTSVNAVVRELRRPPQPASGSPEPLGSPGLQPRLRQQ
jgi:hypothetical protein